MPGLRVGGPDLPGTNDTGGRFLAAMSFDTGQCMVRFRTSIVSGIGWGTILLGSEGKMPRERNPAEGRRRLTTEAISILMATCASRPLVWRLSISVVAVIVAIAVRWMFLGSLETRVVYVTLSPAVVIAACMGGVAGGVLATLLAAVLAHTLIAPIQSTADAIGVVAFFTSSALIVAMAKINHVAQGRLIKQQLAMQGMGVLGSFVEEAPVAIAMFDRDMRYLAASRRWREDYRLGHDIAGRSHYDLFPEISEEWKAIHRRGLAGEVLSSDDDSFVRRDGSTQRLRWEVRPWYRSPGDIGGIVIFAEDVTARLRAMSDLADQEQKVRAILNTVEDGILTVSDDGALLTFNPAAERMFGYSADDIVGRNVGLVIPDVFRAGRARFALEPERSSREIAVGAREATGVRHDGATFPVEIAIGVMQRDSRPSFVVAIRNVSARKATEERLRQSQKFEAVGQLTAGIAHDFNNLLYVISGNLELLADWSGGDEKAKSYISTALDAAARGAELTQHLLAYGRKQALVPQLVNLGREVQQTAALLMRTLRASVKLQVIVGPDPIEVHLDRGQLGNAIINLALNAQDAMTDGGLLLISVAVEERQKVGPLELARAPKGRYGVVTVQDNGAGMPPEVLARAFDPFFTTKETGKGSGLGLSMVYGFMHQSGGYAEIASAQNGGTTVQLFFPLADEARGEISRAAVPLPPPPTIDSHRVLVVEDMPAVRDAVSGQLKSLGLKVISAPAGAEGLEILKAHHAIDLLVTDLGLPGGMNGAQLARLARNLRPGIKLITISGYNSPSTMVELARESNAIHLQKPLKRTMLAEAIATLFASA